MYKLNLAKYLTTIVKCKKVFMALEEVSTAHEMGEVCQKFKFFESSLRKYAIAGTQFFSIF